MRHEGLEALRQPLLRYCMQMTGSRWEAEDLVQDTMMRLIKAAERTENGFGFRYACRTARNLWIDSRRRAKREKVVDSEDAELLGGGTLQSSLDVREHLEELAWRLSPKPFVILLLMEVFDFTAKETAEWLGGSEVAVQVALSRARSRLKKLSRSLYSEGEAAQQRWPESAASGRTDFFEAVLDAFRRRRPEAIQEAYLSLAASGVQLQRIRSLGGKLYFTFRDPDGNVLMVTA